MKFRTGDRVRVAQVLNGANVEVGEVGEVESFDEEYYKVKMGKEMFWFFEERELEPAISFATESVSSNNHSAVLEAIRLHCNHPQAGDNNWMKYLQFLLQEAEVEGL